MSSERRRSRPPRGCVVCAGPVCAGSSSGRDDAARVESERGKSVATADTLQAEDGRRSCCFGS